MLQWHGAQLAPVGVYGPMSWALFIDGSVLVGSVKLATVLLQRLRGDVLAVAWQLAKDSKMGAIFSLPWLTRRLRLICYAPLSSEGLSL
ncbi:hypothetical protein [Prochlorococcus marinus]|uniref:Uncharacterized protein n=1 Tax=Prochlorococcus marinus (strain MIT 9303) TaxID=59922 RepID=A2CCT1_PROM3|nr:hypothetical protein [Prochlorococcus marinus]ABM79291.1 Hypothetical protein P9303_25601 [Prochlorococcus marinus str. MIT 9303]